MYKRQAKDKEIAPVVGGSAQFRTFIKDELFQEVNRRYRTKNENGILGESLAGLFVTETFLSDPAMFDFYIAFDPSLWWNEQYLVKAAPNLLAQFPATEKRFWFASSGAKDIVPHTRQLAKELEKTNLPLLRWKYTGYPKEKHSTIFRATKTEALVWALGIH